MTNESEGGWTGAAVERRVVNPWTWQDDFGLGFVQGVEVTGGRTLYLAGAASIDADGEVIHHGDVRAQMLASLDNVETILEAVGMRLEHVVRLNRYVRTSVLAELRAAMEAFNDRLAAGGCRASGTLLGVEALARPEMLCELEATAVAPCSPPCSPAASSTDLGNERTP